MEQLMKVLVAVVSVGTIVFMITTPSVEAVPANQTAEVYRLDAGVHRNGTVVATVPIPANFAGNATEHKPAQLYCSMACFKRVDCVSFNVNTAGDTCDLFNGDTPAGTDQVVPGDTGVFYGHGL